MRKGSITVLLVPPISLQAKALSEQRSAKVTTRLSFCAPADNPLTTNKYLGGGFRMRGSGSLLWSSFRTGAGRIGWPQWNWACSLTSAGASYATQLAIAGKAEECGFPEFFRSDHLLVIGDGDGLPGPRTRDDAAGLDQRVVPAVMGEPLPDGGLPGPVMMANCSSSRDKGSFGSQAWPWPR